MDRLPYVPKAQMGESPLSILRRSAINNGYQRVLALLHSLVPFIDHSIGMLGYIARNPALFRRLASLLGIQESCFDQVIYERKGNARKDELIWQGLTIPYNDLQIKTNKICIHCYQEQGYALSEWDHIAAVGCHKHRVELYDHCPECQKLWTYDREPLSCGCNHDKIFKRLQSLPAEHSSLLSTIIKNQDQNGIEKISQIVELLRWWKQIGLEFTQKSEAAFIYQVFHDQGPDLGPSETGEALHSQTLLLPLIGQSDEISQSIASSLRSKIERKISVTRLQSIYINRKSAQVLLGISRARFDEFITQGLVNSTGSSRFSLRDLNKLLLSSAWLPFSRKIQKDFMTSNANKSVSLAQTIKSQIGNQIIEIQSKAPESGDKSRAYLSVSDVAKKMGTNTESIRHLIKANQLAATKGTPKSPVQWAIDPIEFKLFNERYVFASSIAREAKLPVTTTSSRLVSAGIKPISGPGIDECKTFLFSRDDIKGLDLLEFLKGPYQSPAGRKPKGLQAQSSDYLNSSQLAHLLGINAHQVRDLVREGWISGDKNSQGHYRFSQTAANRLLQLIDEEYMGVDIASQELDMSVSSFNRTWVYSGYAQQYTLGSRQFIARNDFDKIHALWTKHATSPYIGESIGRDRSFCLNLEKMGLISPAVTLGKRHKKVKLFPREHPIYQCYLK
jgi:hypothetical protein